MERGQFTFYRSYWEALQCLPQKEQLKAFLAICSYALDEKNPNLTGASAAAFLLIKPTLDAGRKKAENRIGKGTNKKQVDNKTKSNAEQNRKEKEVEKESEVESEKEVEKESSIPPIVPLAAPKLHFDLFWEAYPKKVGKDDARKAFQKAIAKTDLSTMLRAVEAQKQSKQWQEEAGRFIPNPSTWLNQGRWQDELQSASGTAPSAALSSLELESIRRIMQEGAE